MNVMHGKNSKGRIEKAATFIAPGQLAKERVHGQKSSKIVQGIGNQEVQNIRTHKIIGGFSSHSLFVHYGEDKWEEDDFTEDSSFLDILTVCKNFIDIYSTGVKITDEDGKAIRNDKDVLAMLKKYEGVKNITIYLDVDKKAQPLPFKLPQDNPTFGSCYMPRVSSVKDVGTEHYESDEPRHDEQKNHVVAAQKERKVRGKNVNKAVVALRRGEKHEIQFYNNRGVGVHHKSWSRHLGKIVRTKSMCPVRIKTWKELTERDKDHMWSVVKECFSNPKMELYREHNLEHMDQLWTAWRSTLNVKYVTPCKTKAEALKNVPPEMNVKDWEWLVTEKFLTEEFQNFSKRNSNNRVKGAMPHRTGSKPHRQLIYEMGGNVNKPPNIASIFHATRQRNGALVEPAAQEKYDEIVTTVKSNASLAPIEVVEKCFGPQRHSHVFGFGGGMKRKHFNDSHAIYTKEIEAKLIEKEEENNNLKRRMDEFERRLSQMEDDKQPTSTSEAPLPFEDELD